MSDVKFNIFTICCKLFLLLWGDIKVLKLKITHVAVRMLGKSSMTWNTSKVKKVEIYYCTKASKWAETFEQR